MVVLNDRPINIEAKAHLLNDDVTPEQFMFVRNNGKMPADLDPENWSLLVGPGSIYNFCPQCGRKGCEGCF